MSSATAAIPLLGPTVVDDYPEALDVDVIDMMVISHAHKGLYVSYALRSDSEPPGSLDG